MRIWLDRHHSQPVLFSRVPADHGIVFRFEFAKASEAVDFVATFGGRLLRPEPESSAA